MLLGRPASVTALRSCFATTFSSSPPTALARTVKVTRSFRDSVTRTLFPRSYAHALAYRSPSMDQNGDSSTEARSKRKQPPTPSNERPMKQMKPQPDLHSRNGTYIASTPDLQPAGETPSVSLEGSLEDLQSSHIVGAVHDTAEWQKTIEKVVRNVVSIHFCQTCAFDTESAVSSEATGFVVDAEKGYILTNRVCPKDVSLIM